MSFFPKTSFAEIMIVAWTFVVWMNFDSAFTWITLLLHFRSLLVADLNYFFFFFFFVFILELPHASWTSDRPFRNLPIMIFFNVQIEWRWTRIISATATFEYSLRWILSIDFFDIFVSLTILIKNTLFIILIRLHNKVLWCSSFWSHLGFLRCSFRIFSIVLFLDMHIESWSRLID